MDSVNIIDRKGFLKFFEETSNHDEIENKTIKIIACGDTSPVRRLEDIVIKNSPLSLLGELTPLLKKGDIVFANLEAPYSIRGKPVNRIPTFRLSPSSFSVINAANINVVSLANNHIFDYGIEAFDDTVQLLRENRIAHFGAGRNEADARQPAIMTIKGIRFGFIGFRDPSSRIKMYSDGTSPTGVTPEIDFKNITNEIKHLRPQVDWLIVSLHFGWEYKLSPSPRDVDLCRKIIDQGADMIFGHHPHYPQGIEIYNDRIIVYSLGNFIWDQNFSGHTNSSYLLEIHVTKQTIRHARIIPFELTREYQLILLKDPSALNEINEISILLKDKKLLDEQWYFTCRNKVIELCMAFWQNIFKNKIPLKYFLNFLKNILSPRSIYTHRSLLVFILTGKAITYELKRKFGKNVNV